MNNKIHQSVHKMWKKFSLNNDEYKVNDIPNSFYFCDNKKDADECAELVVKSIKQATAGSLWSYKKSKENLPKKGDLSIVTDWDGKANAIVRTTNVEKVPYNLISPTFAQIEGEGDKSLEYWKKVHWDFFSREMKAYEEEPTEDMIIVCEYFETIWTEI